MKKLLYCAAALAGLFFAASCQQENLEPVQQSSTVTFTVEAPATIQTKAIADGLNVDELIYEVWLTDEFGKITAEDVEAKKAQKLYQGTTTMQVDEGVNKATLNLDLVNDQKFTILFWAQVKNTGVYKTDELNAVTYTKVANLENAYAANDERLAAFYSVAYVDDCSHVTKDGKMTTGNVTLRRPFAQVNLGTLNTSIEEESTTGYTISLEESNMILNEVPTVFNVVNSEVSGYKTMQFMMYNVPAKDPANDTLTVNNKAYWYAGMNYVFAGVNDKRNITLTYNIKTKLNGGMEALVTNEVPNVPLRENYRTNIIGNLLTSNVDYEIVVDAEFNEPAAGEIYPVTTDEQLLKAISADAEIIDITLGADLNITAAAANKLGGPKTKKIIIDGSKLITKSADANLYTLNVSTTYDVVFSAVNPDAILVLRNLNLTSSKESGTWDIYDIQFKNTVEMENVNALQSIAFVGENKTATLKDVTIAESHDYYALWISTKGMNVEWTGGAINSDGRGIKIDEQYVAQPAATTLKVTGVDFNTKAKGAIMVKSSAPVSIEVSDIDIEDVAADPINAVWVDEDAADYFDLVTVKGAIKVQEGSKDVPVVVTNTEELKAAIKAANNTEFTNIYLRPATYTGAFDIDAKKVNLIGENKETTIIDGLVFGLGASHIHLSNITLTNANPVASESARHKADYYCLGAYAAAFVIEDCVFNVSNQGNAAGKGAINIGDGFNAYSANDEYELIVKNTVFNCNGERPIRAKTSSWIEGCTFVDQHRYAIQVQGNNQAKAEKVVFKNNTIIDACKTSGEPFVAGLSLSGSMKLSNVSFTISGNTEGAKFVYDAPDEDITITSCTLNGQAIAAGQCVTVDSKTKEVLFDANPEYHYVAATADLTAALKGGASKIMMLPGNYELANPTIAATEVLIEGADKENCVLKITKQIRAKDGVTVLTLKNLTTQVPTGLNYDEHNFAWIHYLKAFNMVNCNSDGRIRLNSHGANIEGCTFTVTTSGGFDGYALHYQGADKSTVNVKSCTFNTAGKAIVMYNEGKPVFDLNVDDCTFTSSDSSTDKAAIQMHTEWGISGTLDINHCNVTGFADVNGGLWNELNNNTKKPTQKFTITVDGNTVQQAIPEGYTEVAAGLYKNGVKYIVISADGLQKMNEMFADKSAGRDAVLELYADIDFTGKTWTPVDSHADTAFEIAEINGNNHTISNMTINGQAMFTRFAGSGDVVVKNITFDNATVNSNSINTSILTVHSYQNVLLNNVDVKNSSITGGYKVAPLIATVYNESSSTVTATLKNCDVENVTVKATTYDFCTAGMVAFVYADDNDKIEFENCTVKDVKLYAPNDSYKAHAAVYTTGSEGLYNEAAGVTVTNVTFEAL